MAYTQDHRSIAITTPLGKDKLLLKSITITEQLGRPFVMKAELLSEEPAVDFLQLLGKGVTIRWRMPEDGGEEKKRECEKEHRDVNGKKSSVAEAQSLFDTDISSPALSRMRKKPPRRILFRTIHGAHTTAATAMMVAQAVIVARRSPDRGDNEVAGAQTASASPVTGFVRIAMPHSTPSSHTLHQERGSPRILCVNRHKIINSIPTSRDSHMKSTV